MNPKSARMPLTALAFLVFGPMPELGPQAPAGANPNASPYPPSAVIRSMTWHWDTLRSAAPGSDLWPITWAADGNLYTSWGDGGGFGGTNDDGRVSMGFARIAGSPERLDAVNVNGGKNAKRPASFPKKGKADGLIAIGSTLYAWVNMQDGEYPDVDARLAWSTDQGATWRLAPWAFRKGAGNVKPATFLNFGKGYTGVPADLKGYVYFYGARQGDDRHTVLGRAPQDRLRDQRAYEYLARVEHGHPRWSRDPRTDLLEMEFTGDVVVSYLPGLHRFLAGAFHTGPGQLGIFDAPQPWGPWTTVAWYDHWGGMGPEGWGLTCSFPAKWVSADGRTLWCVFSVYGKGGQSGIAAHDRFNAVKVSLHVAGSRGT